MGKGDKKSKKGKIAKGSYGRSRPRKAKKVTVAKKPDGK
jgi:30S ribosomal protein S31